MQKRHNISLCYTNIFFYEMRKQKVRFRAVSVYNLIFFYHSLDPPKASIRLVTTSRFAHPMLINPVAANLARASKRNWAPKPGKVILAKCTVEFDPENIRFWMKCLNAFSHPPQLLHSKNVGGICKKINTLFSKCNRLPFKTCYQTANH